MSIQKNSKLENQQIIYVNIYIYTQKINSETGWQLKRANFCPRHEEKKLFQSLTCTNDVTFFLNLKKIIEEK